MRHVLDLTNVKESDESLSASRDDRAGDDWVRKEDGSDEDDDDDGGDSGDDVRFFVRDGWMRLPAHTHTHTQT